MNDTEAAQQSVRIIEQTLAEYNISAKVLAVDAGEQFTRYTIQLHDGATAERILPLDANIALNLSAIAVRIDESNEGDDRVYIETSNGKTPNLSLSELQIQALPNSNNRALLGFIVGKDVKGDVISADLASMPHLMIGGQTGSGKSTMLNNILVNLLPTRSPKDLRIILIDPKQVEFSQYARMPHLLQPVATKPEEWMGALHWVEQEVIRRSKILADSDKSDIEEYNLSAVEPLPRIIFMTDEFSDIMMTDASEIERIVSVITKSAQAVGIHLIISTSRPSADVYSQIIRDCFTERMAFTVANRIDSLTLLDQPGAEKLLGRGDLLYKSGNNSNVMRLQAAYVSDEDIEHTLRSIEMT